MNERYKPCTVAELQEMLKIKKKSKIAEKLGCPCMTLHRILKNMEEYQPDPKMSIWHYTS